jgi:hypothetical protein
VRADAAHARGDARDVLLQRLTEIDDRLAADALAALDAPLRATLERDADAELAPFRPRMADDAYAQSRRAALHRLVRQHFGLPSL